MGSCLIGAVSRKVEADKIAVCDNFKEKAEEMRDKFSVNVCDIDEVSKNSAYIVLGVKPQAMADLLKSISPILAEREKNGDNFVLVTMAAGVSTDKIKTLAGGDYKVIRIMPNTPCQVGEGMVLYCASEGTKKDDIDVFLNDMSHSGVFDAIEESKIDMASAVSGCGPAFCYMFIEALADGGVKCGLSREKALLYACQTLKGSAKMVMETDIHPEKLKDNVCSPGGSTIEGVEVLEKYAFRAAVADSVNASYKRTVELGK